MKKIFAFMLMLVSMVTAVQASDIYTKDPSVLPVAAQQTLSKFFPKKSVNHIKVDKKFLGNEDYEVVLNDGTEIEFDSKGQVKEVDNYNGVPSGMMLKAINTYIKNNFKGSKVIKLEVDRNSYEVELSNGVELKFDRAGKFLRMDR